MHFSLQKLLLLFTSYYSKRQHDKNTVGFVSSEVWQLSCSLSDTLKPHDMFLMSAAASADAAQSKLNFIV